MMNTKKIPAVLSLLAGLIALIIMFIGKVEMLELLTTLFIVLLSFYVFGCIVRAIVNKCLPPEEEEIDEDEDEQVEVVEAAEEIDEE